MSVSIGPLALRLPENFPPAPDSYDVLIALFAVVLSLVVGVLLGPLRTSAHAFWGRFVDGVFAQVGRKLDRPSRPPADLALRGFALGLAVLTTGWVAGTLLERLGARLGRHFDISVVALSFLLSTSSVFFLLNRVRKGLENPRTATERAAAIALVSRASGTDLSGADEFALVRAALPICTRGLARGLVAPVIWFLAGGLPLAFAACGLDALSRRFADRDPPASFALMIVWIDRLAGLIPDILSAFILAFSALFTHTAGFFRALKGLLARKGVAGFSQGGRPLSVAAWALNISVGGPSRSLEGIARNSPWIGPEGATARLDPRHLRRFLYLAAVAHLIVILALLAVGYT